MSRTIKTAAPDQPAPVIPPQTIRARRAGKLPVEALAYFQNTMTKWLSSQKSQQSANEQFLATQERVMMAFMSGAPAANQPLPERTAAVARPSAPAAGPAPLRVAPAPSLAPARPPLPAGAVAYPGSPAPAAVQPAAFQPTPVQPAAVLHRPVASNHVETNGNHSAVANGHAVAASVAAPAGGPPTTDQFRRDLLETVTLRTGYPIEMLNEALPLEAGLGIDSIKTLEIFNALKQYHPYFRDDDQQDQDDVLVEFAQLKTLGKIIGAYDLKRQRFLPPAVAGRPL